MNLKMICTHGRGLEQLNLNDGHVIQGQLAYIINTCELKHFTGQHKNVLAKAFEKLVNSTDSTTWFDWLEPLDEKKDCIRSWFSNNTFQTDLDKYEDRMVHAACLLDVFCFTFKPLLIKCNLIIKVAALQQQVD